MTEKQNVMGLLFFNRKAVAGKKAVCYNRKRKRRKRVAGFVMYTGRTIRGGMDTKEKREEKGLWLPESFC